MIEYQEQESDNVAWITIDRPESANSLTPEHMEEVVGYIEQAEESEDVKTAVITGSGGTFCAGGDLEYIREIDEGGADAFATNLVEMLGAVEGADVPVLAAIEGAVYGAGFELVVACDLAVATETSTFGLPETRMGLYPPLTAERVAEIGGKKRVMELVLTDEPVDAETAYDWGLVNRVVPRDELRDEVDDFVSLIAEAEPNALRAAKSIAVGGVSEGERGRMRRTLRGLFSEGEAQRRIRAAADDVTSDDDESHGS